MATISVSLPSDGQTIDAADYNTPINTIVSEINGNLDNANIKAGAAIDRSKIAGFTDGWEGLGYTPNTVTYNGNRSYDMVYNSVNLTGSVSNGMRQKFTRTVTAPTQCADLESGSSHYFNKTSPAGTTFTDDFNTGAWIKLESYGAIGGIVTRYNGTSGWIFRVNADGTISLIGYNASSANFSLVSSYQSVPLNKWVHVSAQLDMSAFTATTTTSYIMIDGVDVPASVSRGGTNPTALIQAGNLEVGAYNGGTAPFDGKLAQVWYSSAKITQANIKTFISQGMSGSETSIVSHYTLSNSLNDSNANANNLTAQNSAVATATDTPFAGGATGTTEYGIITANTFSTNTTLTVQVPEGYAIPTSGGVSAVSYSTQDTPYGFPKDKGKWDIETLIRATTTGISIGSVDVWTSYANYALTVPIGSWKIRHHGSYIQRTTVNRAIEATFTLKNATYLPTTSAIYNHPLGWIGYTHASVAALLLSGYAETNVILPAQATFTPSVQIPAASGTETWEIVGARAPLSYTAEFNYV